MQELITPQSVALGLAAPTKREALQQLSQQLAPLAGLHEQTIFTVLMEREKLGTTGVGHGIAIPHGKISSLDRVIGFFARFEPPVPFESLDERPVDLMFLLLAPEDAGADHLKALAKVSRLMRDAKLCEKLRKVSDAQTAYTLLTTAIPASNAA